MQRRNVSIVIALIAVATAACRSDPVTPRVTPASSTSVAAAPAADAGRPAGSDSVVPAAPQLVVGAFEPDPIEWEQRDDATDSAWLEVPIDYDDPAGDRLRLRLVRYNALDQEHKIGTLLVNPGGPGVSGTFLATGAADLYDRELRERFDILAWDPRGTGESSPAIDCIDNYDTYYAEVDTTPETDAQRAAILSSSERFAAGCVERSGGIIAHVGTNDSARDIDTIRRALGEDTISYFGFSYGSELGAVWATMFPHTVRAAVLDGGVDPNADSRQSTVAQYEAVQAVLEAFLAQCSADTGCPFHHDGDARSAYAALLDRLDADPIEGNPGRALVNRDVAVVATIEATYSDRFWPTLAQSLAAAETGDGSGLLALYDAYYRRRADGTWSNELEAFQVITCVDDPESATVAEADSLSAALHEVAPLLVPEGSAGGYTCAMLPPTPTARADITGAGAGPIVVIGTTGDAATPLASSVALAKALEAGVLVTVDAAQHTGYGANRCVVDVVNRYLVALEPPATGTECS